ncbi:MAG: GerMN domain-containing protein [Bacillota bacterium]|nr:GerMN domain-containing protein [Bacillota bacterium]
MKKKVFIFLAIGILVVCLLSGGCLKQENDKLSDWKDLLKLPVKQNETVEKAEVEKQGTTQKVDLGQQDNIETMALNLYFGNATGTCLEAEARDVQKTEGIARCTIQELFKGPARKESINVFPEGTHLLDINVKPDGMCIIDLSREVTRVESYQQEKLMVYAIVNTLAQFPSIETVKFRIEGEDIDTLAGYIHLGDSVKPDLQV